MKKQIRLHLSKTTNYCLLLLAACLYFSCKHPSPQKTFSFTDLKNNIRLNNTGWFSAFKMEEEGYWNPEWELNRCYFRIDTTMTDTVSGGNGNNSDTICCLEWKMTAGSGEIIRFEEYSSTSGSTFYSDLHFTFCKNDSATGDGNIHVVNKKRGILAMQSWQYNKPFYCASCAGDTFLFCHDIEYNTPRNFRYTIYEKGKVSGVFSSDTPMNYNIHEGSKKEDAVWITGDDVKIIDSNFPKGILIGLNEEKISQ